jgi:hypothetical protein
MNLNLLDPKLIVLAAVVIVIIAVLAWLYVRKRRSTTAALRQKFGPEYERAVLKHGSEPGVLFDENSRLSCIQFRSTCGRHFCRPSPSGGELPVCA